MSIKLKDKYFHPILLFICVYIFGLFIHGFSTEAVNWIYTYLNHLFPKAFPIYNRIYDIQEYLRIEHVKGAVAIFVSLLLINLIAMRIDNRKYERTISLTDGEYLIKDGIRVYVKEFFVIDTVVSTVIPCALTIPAYFLSEDVLDYFGLIFWNWLGYNMKSIFDLFPAMLIAAAFSFVSRMLVIPHCVRAWRAAWMTDI